MKSTKETNEKVDDEINNNVKLVSNLGNKVYRLGDYQINQSCHTKILSSTNQTDKSRSDFKLCKNIERLADINDDEANNLDTVEPIFETLKTDPNYAVEMQRISTKNANRDAERSKDMESVGTMSRKHSIISQELDKRVKRKTSTVLELKNYAWTEEENETTKSEDQLKRQKQLQAAITKRLDQELIDANKKKNLKNTQRNRNWLYILVMAFLILSMVIASNYLEIDSKTKNSYEYRIVFREKELRTFDLLDDNGRQVLTIHYGLKIPRDIKPIKCTKLSKGAKTFYFCRDWLHRASLTIGVDNKPNRINCYNIKWASYTSKEELKDCFELKNGYWFGMGLVRNEPWPLNNWKQKMVPFVTSDIRSENCPFGSIIRRYWISSDGISISVPLDVPLHMSYNNTDENGKESNQMCFQANLAHYPYDAETSVKLEYSICTGGDLKQLHTYSSKVWSQSSITPFDLEKSPEMEFIRKPIWITHHLTELNQSALHKFTKQINDITNVTGFLLIDDRWQNQIGELRINTTNFPNPTDTFKSLTNRGWRTMLSVSPLINIVSDLLHETAYQKRIIHDLTLKVPLLTKCSPEEHLKFCAVIDIMQLTNGEWLKRRLIDNIINRYSIDGLMFHGIEVSRMPQYHHNQLHNVVNPDYFQVNYIDIAASTSTYIGMTTAAGIKDVQGFLRIPPLENSFKALRSIIPTVLNLGLVGFSVINTGSVGGDIIIHAKDDELYIRWLELSLFLPIIQFSKVENIDSLNNIKTFEKYQHIRKTTVIPVMERCMSDYNQNGWPIIRALWWLDPQDPDLYLIDDQFAVGEELVVALILNKGQTRRNITLPSGIWMDMITLKNEKGGKTLLNYEIGLDQIAYFKRVKEFK